MKMELSPRNQIAEMPRGEQRRWLRYREAGALLGVSGEAMRMKVRRGQIGYTTIGHQIFIDRQELERLLEQGKTHAVLRGSSG
jgi:excisionase family DNA binding protein